MPICQIWLKLIQMFRAIMGKDWLAVPSHRVHFPNKPGWKQATQPKGGWVEQSRGGEQGLWVSGPIALEVLKLRQGLWFPRKIQPFVEGLDHHH